MLEEELQEMRAKGLCFCCDDKWLIGHWCRKRELSVLLMEDIDEEGTEEIGSEPPPSPIEEICPKR